MGVEQTLAIGTSALRDAENSEAFLRKVDEAFERARVTEVYVGRFATRLLSGAEEAELTFRGVSIRPGRRG